MLTSVIDACATHMSARHDGCLPAYFGSLYHGVVNDLARILGALVLLNVNVVLLFIFGILAAHRSGSTWRGTIFFALMNAGLGYLIVAIELELD